MSGIWKPASIFCSAYNRKCYTNSKDNENEAECVFEITSKLFYLILELEKRKLSAKRTKAILKVLNKLMEDCPTCQDSITDVHEKISLKQKFWNEFTTHLQSKDNAINKNDMPSKKLSISYELKIVSSLIKCIHHNSADGSLVQIAIEVSTKLIVKYIQRSKVSINITDKQFLMVEISPPIPNP